MAVLRLRPTVRFLRHREEAPGGLPGMRQRVLACRMCRTAFPGTGARFYCWGCWMRLLKGWPEDA